MALPFIDGAVDSILMSELLEHLPRPWKALAEAHRVLRPGGRLCGSVPLIAPKHGDPHDFFRYTDEGIRSLLCDFSSVEVEAHGNHIGAAWLMLASRSRWFRLFNPVFRLASRARDTRCPEGYTFVAIK